MLMAKNLTGNAVTYELPAPEWRRRVLGRILMVLVLVSIVASAVAFHQHSRDAALWSLLVTAGSMLVGVNTVTYEWPITGVTAPTAKQSFNHQQVSAVITGDGSATTFTVTHNWNLPAAYYTSNGWPEVEYEYLLAAGYTAAAIISSKTANAVAFTCTAFTGAGLRVRLKRPWTPTQ
jgi:hypothetical protein